MTSRNTAIAFVFLGLLFFAGGLFVLVTTGASLSVSEVRVSIALILFVFGAYFFQLSEVRHLRSRIEALEKQKRTPEP